MPALDDPMAEALASLPGALIKPSKTKRRVSGSEKLNGVQPELLDHWGNLDSEFEHEGLQPVIKSGFRTAERQNYLHNHGYPTKGNDGYINISPHQRGTAIDISFPASQKARGRRIIAEYARRNNLHVPSDEPWHIALPKHEQQQLNQSYNTAPTPTNDDPMAEALTSLSGSTAATQPTKRELTGEDVAWHLGGDPNEMRSWKTSVRQKALKVVEEAVAEDERKRASGEEIGPTNLQYQNEMRRKAGLPAISAELNLSGRAQLSRNLGPLQTGPKRKVVTTEIPDDQERDRVRQEVLAERAARQQGPMTQARAALAMRDTAQSGTAVEDEVNKRLAAINAQRAEHSRIESQFTDTDKTEIEDFVSHLQGRGDTYTALRAGTRTIGSGLAYKLAGVSDILGGKEENVLGDWLRRKALAGEISVEDVKRDLPPSLYRDAVEFLTESALGLAEVIATPGGPVAKFAGLAGTEALGRGLPAGEVLTETGKGAVVGGLFKGAEKIVSPAEASLTHNLGTALKRAGVVGAGTTGLELSTGTPLKEAAQAGVTNAAYAGIPSAIQAIRGSKAKSVVTPVVSETEGDAQQRFYHRDWGDVVKAEDQTGARRGRTKVYEANNPTQFHYPRTADLSGAGNQRMVPVRPPSEAQPSEGQAADPMAEALTTLGAKIHRTQEPDAGPAQFRGLDDSAVHNLTTRPVPKGTSRGKREQIAQQQVAARAELERRQGETPIEIIPPDTGLRADTGDVPSFRDYVENRPQGGTKFETLEPGSPDFNQLAQEYTGRYGTQRQTALAQERETAFQLPFIKPDSPGSKHRLNRTIDVVFESESGRQMTKTMTIKARQGQLEKKQKVMSKLLGCLHYRGELLDCVKKLGKQVNSIERGELEELFIRHKGKGLSEYDASMAALSNYHKNLFDATNEMRSSAGLRTVEYKPYSTKSINEKYDALIREVPDESTVQDKGVVAPVSQTDLSQVAINESPVTLQFQMDAVNQAKRPAMLYNPGQEVLPHRKGLARTETEVGIWIHDASKVKASEIRAKVADGTYHELLGITEKKSEATDRVVTSRAPDGTEIESAAVSPEREAEQAQIYQERAPEGRIETGGPAQAAKVISDRLSSAAVVPDPMTEALTSLRGVPAETQSLLLSPAKAHLKTFEMLKRDDPLNPKAKPLVAALNDAGIPTVQSGDLYGKNVVYVDLPGGKYTEGKLTRGVDSYERALRTAKLPAGWKVIRADAPASAAFETGKPEKPYNGARSTAVRLIRKGGTVTQAEANEVVDAVKNALSRPLRVRPAQTAEPTPIKMSGQKLRVGGADAEVIDAQRLDGVDYELFKSGDTGAIRVYDSDSGNVVSLTKHPKFADAAKAYSETVEASGGDVRSLRDRLPANTLKDLPTKTKAAREELPPVRTLSVGRESKAVTERGSEINTRYAIVDLEDLITSHDSILNINPKFPPELQPRERDRAASADQISRIASKLRPDFLGESPKASEGAPIIGEDGIVESGNGRILGIRQAYESKNQGAQAYKNFLFDNAERFGVDPKAATDLEHPVLVRIRTSDVDRPQFVKEANEQSIASMSPVEQARSDAKMLKGPLLDLFRPSESGEIATSGNMNFVRAFMRDVVGPNEVGRYVTASGQVSQEGVARIRNAIFARAFGESPEGLIALEKMAESPDNNVRNVTAAMLRNASGFASLREGIDQGTRYPLDLSSDVAAAMSKMSSLRDQGMVVPDYLNQGALYGEDLTPIQKRLLQVFDENKRGANTIDSILKNYLRGADAAGSPTQSGLFGTEKPSKADFLEAAIQEAIHGQGISPGLFATPNQRLPSERASRGANPEVNPPAYHERIAQEITRPADAAAFAPKLAESPAESEGHPLKRFDSTIDRLKTQEEEARQRLNERGTEFQSLLERNPSELGATTIPQDLYDYVVIGASKLAQRSLNAAQFIDEMVKDFGEAIRKHARAIFKHSRNMVTETQKEIRNERLSKEIADRLFTENVPRDQQRAALKIAARFRTTTDTQGRFLSGFKSRVGEMAKSYGAAGGELTNRLHLGDIARGHEMEEGNKYLSRIQDVYDKTKNDFEQQRISDAVINALENRAEADRYLDTAEKQAVYKDTKEMLDTFREKLNALGYETREDYFTHIRDVDVLDQIISDAKDPKDANLNDLVAAKSRFLQTRVDAKMEIKKDLPRVLFAYLKSVTKEIAYGDAVEYYYDQFPTDIPISLRKNSMDRAISLMQNSLKPEQGRGRFYRTVGRLRSEQYRNFLAYNLKASAQNFTQVDFARMRWTPEARSLSGKMWRNRKALTGPLADAIDLASTEQTPLMRFLEQFKGDEPSGSKGRVSEAFNKYDPFQRSEHRNWALSELGSIINSVVKRPEYQGLKAKMGAEGAINELLKKKDVFDAAVREGATTAAETQVAANPAMRGEFYDAPLHRIVGMFTAFKTRQMQTLGEALRSHEGINGARAQTILRRGLSGDAQPVEVLREVEAQRRAMETMVQKAAKFREDIGIPLRSLNAMVEHLKSQEHELNGIIKRIEPLSGGRAQSAALVAKYFAKVSAISVFFNLLWDSVYSGIAGPEKKDEDAEGRVSTALRRAFWDVLPSPFYGANPSKFLVSPVAPNFERSAPYGNITKRGLARDIASYGTTVIPFAGVIDRATNRRLSSAVVDVVAPKKEKEKKIAF